MAINNKTKWEELINRNNLPQHIAIIMDGNGRWASKRLMPRTMGHRAGMSSLKEVVRACSDVGVSTLTVFAFSTENWKRPLPEVDYLMKLLVEYLHRELDELHANAVRINVLGDYNSLPQQCRQEITEALQITQHNKGLKFNIALNYGSRAEIIAAVKKLASKLLTGEISAEDISEESFAACLTTVGLPDPDLLIRTAGEMRISNFLLWQIAYTELWVTDCLWPDFSREHLMQAIWDFQHRERRFGGI
ncbi:MAG: isoprenyl transferase [Syntrophomonas sp.]|uniref:isoprenyl transferase n=1 Tax=Syntrophomonas sp. TaxID=2053627 RepID=UPI002638EFC2|nr:isoprenyl transferase [Syntrophomonas sp.]MDD2510031.1 isoprenyl transferase [Syntrophomonas sp.]MDD3878631.1 isoprenyl transferase [Syntrophomonas sp.]MDD4626092.1 isoprenyl transferase [Syntrophomonas sp.]